MSECICVKDETEQWILNQTGLLEADPACPIHGDQVEPRSLTVPYGLPRYQVRQHLELNGIEFTEDKRTLESVFQVTATDDQWEAVNRVAAEVWG